MKISTTSRFYRYAGKFNTEGPMTSACQVFLCAMGTTLAYMFIGFCIAWITFVAGVIGAVILAFLSISEPGNWAVAAVTAAVTGASTVAAIFGILKLIYTALSCWDVSGLKGTFIYSYADFFGEDCGRPIRNAWDMLLGLCMSTVCVVAVIGMGAFALYATGAASIATFGTTDFREIPFTVGLATGTPIALGAALVIGIGALVCNKISIEVQEQA